MFRQNRLSLHRLAYAKNENGVTAVSGIKFHAVSRFTMFSRNFVGNERCLKNNEVNKDNLKGNALLLN